MNRIAAVVAGLSLAFVGTSTTIADTINVPGDQPTIAAAINASSNGDVINIAAGIYNEHSLNPDGKAITIQGTVNGDGTLATTIDAHQSGRVFVITSGEGAETVIENLIITGGSGDHSGGIYCNDYSSPTISGCTISGNTANRGGGIYCKDNSNPTISGCTITGNTANWYGGGIFCETSNPTISGCAITSNTSVIGGGGIVCNYSSPTISDCTITSNTTDIGNGGGMFCNYSSPTISDCTIEDNSAGYGGGIYCDHSSPTIWECTIEDNSADYGGGIFCEIGSSPVHIGCTFSSNTPNNLYTESDWNSLRGEGGPSIITLENCTICGTGEHVSGLIVHVGDNHISDCIDEGDLDGDGDVDTDDLRALHVALGINKSDVNNNGCVDIYDLLYVIEDWNEGCTP